MEKWRTTLAKGKVAQAWDEFILRYRRLILSVIRRSVTEPADIDDVFADVCGYLGAADLAVLARHDEAGGARYSTWLVTVVHHRCVDWTRQRDGRRRPVEPPTLSRIQRAIFDRVVVERASHAEAYELIVARNGDLTFSNFLKEVAGMFRTLDRASGKSVGRYFPGPPAAIEQAADLPDELLASADSTRRLADLMATLPADERLAIQLFVIDELPASDVARAVGWPNAKMVYNRVYRALRALRAELHELGVDRVSDFP